MASIQDIYANSDALRAADLPEGVQVPVVIESVRPVEFDDGSKLELRFRGKKKVMLSNRTNSYTIASQHGEDYEKWPGKTIFLQRSETEFRGRIVDCVRVVRNPIAQPASQMARSDESDEIPF